MLHEVKFDESFEQRLTKLEEMVAQLSQQVYELRHRKIMIWADTTTTMDEAIDETWRWLTSQLPEGFTIAEVKWTRSTRNLRILRVDIVYEWTQGLNEVKRKVLDAFIHVPRPYNEEVIVLTHRIVDWKVTHPEFVAATIDPRRKTKHSIVDRERMKKGVKIAREDDE